MCLLTETQIAAVRQARLQAHAVPSPSPPLLPLAAVLDGHVCGRDGPPHPPGAALAQLLAKAWVWTCACVASLAGAAKTTAVWAWRRAREVAAGATAAATERTGDGVRYEALATSSRESGSPGGPTIPDASDEDLSAVSRHVSVFEISRIGR